MGIARRQILAALGISTLAAAFDIGALRQPAIAAQPSDAMANPLADGVASPAMLTTMGQTVLPGPDLGLGYRKVVLGPGEPHLLRRELVTGSPTESTRVLYAVAAFAQMSDLHIIDDKSPARLEFLDRYANPGPPHLSSYPTSSAYRPHEVLSTHATDAMCRAIRNIGSGPRTGLPLQFTIVTGDAVDNAQLNETRWYINLLDGGRDIQANSGQLGLEQCASGNLTVGNPSNFHDAAYWNPDKRLGSGDYYYQAGFPEVPGLLAAARRTYTSTGVGMPWYAAYGNHDAMVQGNLAIDTDLPGYHSLKYHTVNGSKWTGLVHALPDVYDHPGVGTALGLWWDGGPIAASVVADAQRRLLTKSEFIAEHFSTTGRPRGHGFASGSDKAYYAIPSAATDLVQYIVLDTTNDNGSLLHIDQAASGAIDNAQLGWLEDLLRANSSRYLQPTKPPPSITLPQSGTRPGPPVVIPGRGLTDGAGSTVVNQPGVQDKLFVIFCHHTLDTMTNTAPVLTSTTRPADVRWTGEALRRLLLAYPNVIAVVNGHTHANVIKPHPRPAGHPVAGGFWEINSASHIDWPVQSRLVEIGAGPGTVSIVTTVVDIDAPLSFEGDTSTPKALASLERELSANDPQEREQVTRAGDGAGTRRGTALDRNTQLLLPAPFPLPEPRIWGSSLTATTTFVGATNELFLIGTNDEDLLYFKTLNSDAPGWTRFDGRLRTVTAATNADGRVEMFSTIPDGSVLHRAQVAPGSARWTSWTPVVANFIAMAVAPNTDGRLAVFGISPSQHVFHAAQTSPGAGTLTGWTRFGLEELTQIAAATNLDGRVEVFAVDVAGNVLHQWQTSAGADSWSGWSPLEGAPVNTVAVARDGSGKLRLFGANEDGQVFVRSQTGAGASTWTQWTQLDAASNWAQYNIRQLAATNSLGTVFLFGLNPDGEIFERHQNILDAESFGTWAQIDGRMRRNLPAHASPVAANPGAQVSDVGKLVGLSLSLLRPGRRPYQWFVGGLPDGLEADDAGHITGSPTGHPASTTTVEATVIDANQLASTVSFTWTVRPVPPF